MDSHKDSDNEFYLHAKSTAHLSFRRVLVFLGYSSFPNVMKVSGFYKFLFNLLVSMGLAIFFLLEFFLMLRVCP